MKNKKKGEDTPLLHPPTTEELNQLPPPNYTDLIRPMLQTQSSKINYTLQWRLTQIRTLRTLILDHQSSFQTALSHDLHKEPTEALYSELSPIINECNIFLSNLSQWMKPTQKASEGVTAPSFTELRSVSLGKPGCLVITPFNFPVALALGPVVGCLGGGNPVVVKLNEWCPEVSGLLGRLIPMYFDPGVLQVVQGGTEVASALIKEKWSKIFFTGSERIGKIVASEAAKTLTPVVLELGGKCPSYIASDCPDSMDVIANRIIWSKTINCGQACLSIDYLVCHESKVQQLSVELVKALERMFGKDPQNSELARIVSVSHAKRLVELIKEAEDNANSNIIMGGSKLCQPEEKFVFPTIILNPPMTSRLMTEEIFGPILPVVVVGSEEEAIEVLNTVPGTPLSMSVYTKSSAVYEHIIKYCPSSGAIRNDAMINFSNLDIPFGGLGSSGIGNYHGKYSFETFTHKYFSIYKPCHPIWEFFGIRYHPYAGTKSKMFKYIVKISPIPVLHTRWILSGLLAFLIFEFLPITRMPFVKFVFGMIANVLDGMSAFLRSF